MPCPIFNISVCVTDNCSNFKIILSANEEVDLDTLNYESALLVITNMFDNTSQEYDVLEFLPQLLTEPTLLVNANFSNYQDGYYIVDLILNGSNCPTTVRATLYSFCEARCCVDKLWAKFKGNLDNKCDNKQMNTALEAEALFHLLKNAGSCMNQDSVKEILKKLQRICNLEKCNCKCN
jgi:hypothetical protein